MEIKTITHDFDHVQQFDHEVNKALADGWELTARGTLPATPGQKNSHRLLYAELTKLGPTTAVDPGPRDPFDAVREIYEGCARVPQTECEAGRCPLYDWCKRLPESSDPTDWEVPEK